MEEAESTAISPEGGLLKPRLDDIEQDVIMPIERPNIGSSSITTNIKPGTSGTATKFNYILAINTQAVGVTKKGSTDVKINNYNVTNVRTSPNAKCLLASVNGTTLTFLYNGKEMDPNTGEEKTSNDALQLVNITSVNLASGDGTSASKPGEDKPITISSLQPRELFANAAMQGILTNIKDPLTDLNDFTILKIANISFQLAQAMMTQAAQIRSKIEESSTPKKDEKLDKIEINPNEIIDIGDKIVYNIYTEMANKSIDDKVRFNLLNNASYNEKKELVGVGGTLIRFDANNPIITKLHPDSEIKKIGEVLKNSEVHIHGVPHVITDNGSVTVTSSGSVIDTVSDVVNVQSVDTVDNVTNVSKVSKVSEVSKVAEVSVVESVTSVNKVNSVTTVDTVTDIVNEVDVNVTNSTINVEGSVNANVTNSSVNTTVDNMLVEPVNVKVTNASDIKTVVPNSVSVNNFPTQPIKVEIQTNN